MNGAIRIDVSAGELVDKLTILEIKSERIRHPDKRAHVEAEWTALASACESQLPALGALASLRTRLREVNERLWRIEDDIRDCERRQDFGDAFVALARAVYRNNDQRADIKREINILLGSWLIEEKSYASY